MRFFTFILTLALVLSPVVVPKVFGQGEGGFQTGGDGVNSEELGFQTGGDSSSETGIFQNPLGDTTLMGFFDSLLDVVTLFATPVIVFFIILAGFNYVMARGNSDKIQNANRALLYAVIGGVLIIGANLILTVISGTIDQIKQ